MSFTEQKRVRFYTCPRCTRLLMTATDGKETPHECVIPTVDEEVVTEELRKYE